jgi:hypothetical protein
MAAPRLPSAPPAIGQALVAAQLGEGDPGIVHAGQALRGGRAHRDLERVLGGRLRHGRARLFDKQHGVVDEQAGRLRSGIAIDASAIRLPVAGQVAPHRAERCAVRPPRMAIHPRQPHRPIGEGSIQVGRIREALFRPVVLVPATTDQPLAGLEGLFVRAQALQDLGLVAGADQVRAEHRQPQATDMRVRIDQPRHHRRATHVHASRPWVLLRQRISLPDRQDPAIGGVRHRRRHRPRRIHRVDARGGHQGDAILRGRLSRRCQQQCRYHPFKLAHPLIPSRRGTRTLAQAVAAGKP